MLDPAKKQINTNWKKFAASGDPMMYLKYKNSKNYEDNKS